MFLMNERDIVNLLAPAWNQKPVYGSFCLLLAIVNIIPAHGGSSMNNLFDNIVLDSRFYSRFFFAQNFIVILFCVILTYTEPWSQSEWGIVH